MAFDLGEFVETERKRLLLTRKELKVTFPGHKKMPRIYEISKADPKDACYCATYARSYHGNVFHPDALYASDRRTAVLKSAIKSESARKDFVKPAIILSERIATAQSAKEFWTSLSHLKASPIKLRYIYTVPNTDDNRGVHDWLPFHALYFHHLNGKFFCAVDARRLEFLRKHLQANFVIVGIKTKYGNALRLQVSDGPIAFIQGFDPGELPVIREE